MTPRRRRLGFEGIAFSPLVLSIVPLAVSLSSCTRSALTKEESLFAKFSKSFVAAFRPEEPADGEGREGGRFRGEKRRTRGRETQRATVDLIGAPVERISYLRDASLSERRQLPRRWRNAPARRNEVDVFETRIKEPGVLWKES